MRRAYRKAAYLVRITHGAGLTRQSSSASTAERAESLAINFGKPGDSVVIRKVSANGGTVYLKHYSLGPRKELSEVHAP